jgi:hypothetical protein
MPRSFIANGLWYGLWTVVATACSTAHPARDAGPHDAPPTHTPSCSSEHDRPVVCRDEAGLVDRSWYAICDNARAPAEIQPIEALPVCYETADGVAHVSCREPTAAGVFADDPEYLYCFELRFGI